MFGQQYVHVDLSKLMKPNKCKLKETNTYAFIYFDLLLELKDKIWKGQSVGIFD